MIIEDNMCVMCNNSNNMKICRFCVEREREKKLCVWVYVSMQYVPVSCLVYSHDNGRMPARGEVLS